MNKDFKKAFDGLNDEQKKAVTAIDGPVLVIAGPGTGKTQLLALRAAQILQEDATMLPSNILCLTFTDNAADNMRQRLTRYIGQDAYQVAIHTFNSFGSYVMNVHPEFFYEWRDLQTADELTTHTILEEILGRLPGNHLLAARGIDGTFYSLKQLKHLIQDSKKNNLTPGELRDLLIANAKSYQKLTPALRQHWPQTMVDAASLAGVGKLIAQLKPAKEGVGPLGLPSVEKMIFDSLDLAAQESESLALRAKTKPFTAWKDEWLAKDQNNQWIFKAAGHHEKLMAAAGIYDHYQQALQTRGMADFNDQIMWVVRILQQNDELRYNLQERFNYVMIDEFQDTNRAQLMLARFISDAPVHEGRPNLMVVGDDDQAIYRFQGADIGNVEIFTANYKLPKQITLIKNYRSLQTILSSSRKLSRQIKISLEKQQNLVKDLVATVSVEGPGVSINEFNHESQHYAWVASQINQLLSEGVVGKEIAVLGRERAHLDALLPYLRTYQVAIDYERSENVLEQTHVLALLAMARLVLLLGEQRLDEANALLPKILSEPMWAIEPADIWKVARAAYKEKRYWLDIIFDQKQTKMRQIADFFMELSGQSASLPAEQVLDRLVGTGPAGADSETQDEAEVEWAKTADFISPFKKYFFGDELLKGQPGEYLTLLSHLSTLRRQLRNYQTGQGRVLSVRDLVEFVESYMRTETLRMLDTSPHRENDNAVKLITVHKAKGLEFNNVFVLALENSSWTKTGRSSRFSYPANLQIIKPTENDADDSLRLLFVAMTRARHNLQLNYYLKDENNKFQQPFAPLLELDIEPAKPQVKEPAKAMTEQYEQRWLAHHASAENGELSAFLSQDMERYQLSATHLNNFLDISAGGPLYFMTQNLLHFPATMSAHAAYGSAMHTALKKAHEEVISGNKLRVPATLQNFLSELAIKAMAETDRQYFVKKGHEALGYYLKKQRSEFRPEQVVEFDFKDQGVAVGDARLKGFIDRMDFDKPTKTIIVSDYKTGSSATKWQVPPSSKEYERIKLHRYRQQLLFYKLLVDGSSEWGRNGWIAQSGIIRFIEADQGKIRSLVLPYDVAEMDSFKALVIAVWRRIQALDFADTSNYEPTHKGILAFEADLIAGK